MVGENIQRLRSQIQSSKAQLMSGLPIGEKIQNVRILRGNPGILGNFRLMDKIQNRIQSIGRKGIASGEGSSNPQPGVFTENSVLRSGRNVISV